MRRTKPTGTYVGKEDKFQRSAIILLETLARPHGVPKEAIMHIPSGAVLAGNEAQRARQAKKLKDQGWRSGYPDIMIFHPEHLRREALGSRYVGLAIELKVWPNNLSDAQREIHAVLEKAGWKVVTCYGMAEVEESIKGYLG